MIPAAYNGWIPAEEHRPTQADADAAGCVLAWHRHNGAMVTGWHQVRPGSFFLFWQRMPCPPPGYEQWAKDAR